MATIPPTHRSLFNVENEIVDTVMDCFSGLILRAFTRRYKVGEIIKSGPICMPKDRTRNAVEAKFWVVTGYSDWRTARAMVNKTKSRHRSLLPNGVWHEVISE